MKSETGGLWGFKADEGGPNLHLVRLKNDHYFRGDVSLPERRKNCLSVDPAHSAPHACRYGCNPGSLHHLDNCLLRTGLRGN